MRQFPETLTAQKHAGSPRSECSWKPGRFMSAGSAATSRRGQDAFDLAGALRRNKPPIPFLVEAPEPLVVKPDDHPLIVTRYVSGCNRSKLAYPAAGVLLLAKLTPPESVPGSHHGQRRRPRTRPPIERRPRPTVSTTEAPVLSLSKEPPLFTSPETFAKRPASSKVRPLLLPLLGERVGVRGLPGNSPSGYAKVSPEGDAEPAPDSIRGAAVFAGNRSGSSGQQRRARLAPAPSYSPAAPRRVFSKNLLYAHNTPSNTPGNAPESAQD